MNNPKSFAIRPVNNLQAMETVIDHIRQRLIVNCLDNGNFIKSYYLDFRDLESSKIEEQIEQVMLKGGKI